jgi:hypothetical protein
MDAGGRAPKVGALGDACGTVAENTEDTQFLPLLLFMNFVFFVVY